MKRLALLLARTMNIKPLYFHSNGVTKDPPALLTRGSRIESTKEVR